MKFGRWKRAYDRGMMVYICGRCGQTWHIYDPVNRMRKLVCDVCGRVNIYPEEKAFETTCSLWEDDEPDDLKWIQKLLRGDETGLPEEENAGKGLSEL